MKLKVYENVYNINKIETYEDEKDFNTDKKIENNLINLYPDVEFQTFKGFGGALTEASGYVFSKLSYENKKLLVKKYFSEEGLNYNNVRMHLDSCDFALGNYSAVEDEKDTKLETFSLERDEKYILPLFDFIKKETGKDLEVLISPWSPPAFMKSNKEKNNGGYLLKEYYGLWAEYFCKYIIEYRKRGVNITALTVQNEPNAKQTWDSCLFTPEEEREFIKNHLYPKLVENNLNDVEIIIWDHNKERVFERGLEVINDKEMEKMVAGIGMHWYSGDHFESLQLFKQKFPDKRMIFTESCIEYSRGGENKLDNAKKYVHNLIGDINSGIDLFLDWNILLDSNGGPNHVENLCEAPIMTDENEVNLVVNPSYYFLGNFTKFIKEGYKKIGHSKFTDKLEVTAFKGEDKIVSVIYNNSEEDIKFFIRLKDEVSEITIKKDSVITVEIKK